ncbi:MAG: transposase [Desulfuromonadales bacterium]
MSPPVIELSLAEKDSFLQRMKGIVDKDDFAIIVSMTDTLAWLNRELEQEKLTIARLKALFGITSEKSKDILPPSSEQQGEREKQKNGLNQDEGTKENRKKPGHGRNGADKYSGATIVSCPHGSLKPGDPCPECTTGKLYEMTKPGIAVRIRGNSPLSGIVYQRQRLRCNPCMAVFVADLPHEAGESKYDASAQAMIVLLKYGHGFPLYRLNTLHAQLGIPLPISTQWGLIEQSAYCVLPVYEHLFYLAAQGHLIHNDDTGAKVLSLLKENKSLKGDDRKGIFTTSILSHVENNTVVLYFTGRLHAGENLAVLFQERLSERDPPLHMCDASSRNRVETIETIDLNCLVHGRRYFVKSLSAFPDQCCYVIESLGKVFHNDAQTWSMTDKERLDYHIKLSAPVMEGLKLWMKKQIEDKCVEPDWSLGKAITYMQNHWIELTAFLRIPGAPLDNNCVERALKKVQLHRKNAYFFKTEFGAQVGDMFMGLIETCVLAETNPFEYLVTLIEKATEVKASPQKWLPWNYLDA